MTMNNTQENQRQNNNHSKKKPDWYYATEKYAVPSMLKAIIQLLDTFIPYFVLLALMVVTVKNNYSYWITLILGILAGGLLVRIFVIFHDCVHYSFFASRTANRVLGWFCGILACTPFDDWQWAHGKHHATAGDLDRRGYGSVWLMTVDEYRSAPWLLRLKYRLYRNPFILFGVGPEIFFLIINRFPNNGSGRRAHRNVHITTLVLVVIFSIAIYGLGFWDFLRIAAPIWIVSTTAGVWLFYIQHQFPGVYWARHDEWDIMTVALKGCSYYKLPKILQWFTASIGIHNVHHLRTAIPNYNLQKCYDETLQMQDLKSISIQESLSAYRLKLWDEKNQRLVPFNAV
jgi:acyl-lipid omega-6 desaturase (Delta-12 desaturase)